MTSASGNVTAPSGVRPWSRLGENAGGDECADRIGQLIEDRDQAHRVQGEEVD
jgi:hypothetical protein